MKHVPKLEMVVERHDEVMKLQDVILNAQQETIQPEREHEREIFFPC